MFEIEFGDEGIVDVDGRFDAAQAVKAQAFLDQVEGQCVLNLAKLKYISSAGLGVLLKTHKRLMGAGSGINCLKLYLPVINDAFSAGYENYSHVPTNFPRPGM